MSVTLISVSHDIIVSNKHEEQTRHYYVDFQQMWLQQYEKCYSVAEGWDGELPANLFLVLLGMLDSDRGGPDLAPSAAGGGALVKYFWWDV